MNAFYSWLFDVLPGSTARSRPLEAEFQSIETGFDRVQVKTSAAMRAPDGEALGALPARADRANKACVFDASGEPAVSVSASSAEMQAAIAAAAATALDAAAAAAAAASIAAAVNTLHIIQIREGII